MVRTLPINEDGVRFAVNVLLDGDIIHKLNRELTSFMGLYRFGKKIETGEIIVFAAIENDRIVGIYWGEVKGDTFECHYAFKRKVNVLKHLQETEKLLREIMPDIKYLVGYIPETYRASILMALRMKFRKNGFSDLFFQTINGEQVRTIELVKELL